MAIRIGVKCRQLPLAILLLVIYSFCMFVFCTTLNGNLTTSYHAPWIAIWISLGLGIGMCIVSYVMVEVKPYDTWEPLPTITSVLDCLTRVEVPAQFAYLGPSFSSTKKYSHHFILLDYQLVTTADCSETTDVMLDVLEYSDKFFPRIWYHRNRLISCCPGVRRSCCWGWVGAGQIQKRRYSAVQMLKDSDCLYHVANNGELVSPLRDRLRRTKQRCGEPFWDLMLNNCEHFANWVMTGEHFSRQVAQGPFWELYFINSIGKMIIGAMHNAIATLGLRIILVIVFVVANAMSYSEYKYLYWVVLDITLCYQLMYIIVDISKVCHLQLWCGRRLYCYLCYSDYYVNEPLDQHLLEIGVEPKSVWPHEGLSLKSHYSMPIVPCLFKSFCFYLMTSSALMGGSYIGKRFYYSSDVPYGEMIMSIAFVASVYLFFYPLMASSLDYFLWHKPHWTLQLSTYLIYATGVVFQVCTIIKYILDYQELKAQRILQQSLVGKNSTTAYG